MSHEEKGLDASGELDHVEKELDASGELNSNVSPRSYDNKTMVFKKGLSLEIQKKHCLEENDHACEIALPPLLPRTHTNEEDSDSDDDEDDVDSKWWLKMPFCSWWQRLTTA